MWEGGREVKARSIDMADVEADDGEGWTIKEDSADNRRFSQYTESNLQGAAHVTNTYT